MSKSIIISKEDIKLGLNIPKHRKEILHRVFIKYGKLDEFKLNEIIHSEDSPVNLDSNPYTLLIAMKYNLSILDNAIARWYYNFDEEE